MGTTIKAMKTATGRPSKPLSFGLSAPNLSAAGLRVVDGSPEGRRGIKGQVSHLVCDPARIWLNSQVSLDGSGARKVSTVPSPIAAYSAFAALSMGERITAAAQFRTQGLSATSFSATPVGVSPVGVIPARVASPAHVGGGDVRGSDVEARGSVGSGLTVGSDKQQGPGVIAASALNMRQGAVGGIPPRGRPDCRA
ncbi:MAG: hypothetical protein WCA46_26080 [Actinocatenispora sp.]